MKRNMHGRIFQDHSKAGRQERFLDNALFRICEICVACLFSRQLPY